MKTTKWFVLKSKILFAFLIVLQLNSYAQNETWFLVLPDNGEPIDMVQVDDSSYCVLQRLAKDSIVISKVTVLGVVDWRKVMTKAAAPDYGYSYLDIINIKDSILLITGSYNAEPFCLQINQDGGILKEDIFEIENYATFGDCLYIADNKVWLTFHNLGRSNVSIVEYDIFQGTFDSLKTYNQGIGLEFALSPDSILLSAGSETLLYVDSVCDVFKSVELPVESINLTVYNNNLNYYYSKCIHFPGTGYSHGIYCYTRELDSVAYFPDSIYYPTEVYGSWMNANDIIFNGTGEMIIVGEILFMSEWFPTLVNASPLSAVPNFVYTNYNSAPQYSKRVFEAENGYIQLLYYEAAEESKTVIARVSENGDMNSVNENGNKKEGMSVYPNPADDGFSVDFETVSSGTYKIYTEMGVLAEKKEFQNVNSLHIVTKYFRSGLYHLRVLIGDYLHTQKIIINHK